MAEFVYPSGAGALWPTGFTAPTSGVAYVQPFSGASGNLSTPSGSVYPIAVPRIDPGATSGTDGNQYIVPYSAQLFYAALSGIQAEYAEREAIEPEFHAFHDKDKTSYEVLTSWSGLLSAPLENFHMVVEEAQNAISGLVCMDGWNDDMEDYQRRVFDYRILMSGVPSGNRLSNNVSYYNVSSGSTVTINPLDRARSGLFPINVEDAKNLHSQWGVAADGSRTYGTDEFGASGVAAGDQSERDPEFQQHAFVGHFDWLVQSLMWRPPIVESFTKGTNTTESNYVQYDRGNSALSSGAPSSSTVWWHANDTRDDGGAQSVNDPLAAGSGTIPNSEILGDLGAWRVGKPLMNRLMPLGGLPLGADTSDTPTSFSWNPDTLEMYEQHDVQAISGSLSSNIKDYSKWVTASGIVYDPGTGYSDDSADRFYKSQSKRHGSITGYSFAGLLDPDPGEPGYISEPTDPGSISHKAEAFQSAISWISPAASGRWEAAGSSVQAGSGISYPIGSGSEIVIDATIDTHDSPSGWAVHNGRSDWTGLHICVQTNKHIPEEVENTSTGAVASLGFDEKRKGGSLDSFDSWVEGDTNTQFKKLVYVEQSQHLTGDIDPAFDASGQIASGYDYLRRTPSLLNTCYTEGGNLTAMVYDSTTTLAVAGSVTQTNIMTGGESFYVYGDVRLANAGESWRGNNYSFASLSSTTEWSYGISESASAASYPSGVAFTTLKLSDYSPASGTVYTLPLWTKFEEDMAALSTAWTSGAIGYYSPDADLSDGGNHWDAFSSDVDVSGWNAAVNGADPMFGYAEDTGGATIDAITLLDVVSSGPNHWLGTSGAGYSVSSIRLKFPVILGPSGLN
ncbi:MAG: hypothetical protein HOM01_15225 [Kordiimonadaceae bacterium]|jgi:hypothetical protein|nr:hypothetical protein [Kordiimonadaceae bacterium]